MNTLQLDFLLALFRPLLTSEETSFLLDDCSQDHILRLVTEGKLRAISIHSQDAEKRAIRIYRYSVEHLLIAPKRALAMVQVEHVLGHQRPTLLVREVAATLACTERHVHNLCGDGSLSGVDLGRIGRVPRIYRDSLVAFITAREITP